MVRKYDIPLLAGYSQDGSEIYIDKDMQMVTSLGQGLCLRHSLSGHARRYRESPDRLF